MLMIEEMILAILVCVTLGTISENKMVPILLSSSADRAPVFRLICFWSSALYSLLEFGSLPYLLR